MTQLAIEEAGPERLANLDQWFTPPKLARKMVEWPAVFMDPGGVRSVLEPSSGNGALLGPIRDTYKHATLTSFEIDPRWAAETGANCENFLAAAPDFYDLGVMNPPYSDGRDGRFLAHALHQCGTLVALIRTHALHGMGRFESVWTLGRVRRVAYLVRRPSFGGGSPQHEFCAVLFGPETIPAGHEWWVL